MGNDAESKVRAVLESLLRLLREQRTTGEATLHIAVNEGGIRLPIQTTVKTVQK